MKPVEKLTLGGALLFPWLWIWQGLDFTDQGYLVTGYRCFFRFPETTEDSGHMWLTNLVGAIWDALFGGLGVVSMRGLWALCLSAGVLLGFRLTRGLVGGGTASALGALAAAVFLANRRETWFSYNTASSLLLGGMVLCFALGIARRSRALLLLAGVLLGLSPFARFPNILACALPSGLLLAAWLEPERRRALIKDVLAVALGAVGAVLVTLAAIFLRGDWQLFVGGLRSLFEPSMQEAGYSTNSLLDAFLHDQGVALLCGFGVCAACVAVSRLLPHLPRAAAWAVVAFLAAGATYAISRFDEAWRFVVPGASYFLLLALALGLWQRSVPVRVTAWLLLVVVVIAPLGSNNGIKNAHMGLWLAVPFMLGVLHSLGSAELAGQGSRVAALLGLVLVGEGLYRANDYVYRESDRWTLWTPVKHPQLRAQLTSPARARVVGEVLDELGKRVSPGDYLLAYEGTPLLQYLTKTRPYLNRPWLMGWERGDVVAKLAAEAPRRTGCLPVVVVSRWSARNADWPRRKQRLENKASQRGVRKVLNAFLKENGYRASWRNDFFEILEPPAEKRGKCR